MPPRLGRSTEPTRQPATKVRRAQPRPSEITFELDEPAEPENDGDEEPVTKLTAAGKATEPDSTSAVDPRPPTQPKPEPKPKAAGSHHVVTRLTELPELPTDAVSLAAVTQERDRAIKAAVQAAAADSTAIRWTVVRSTQIPEQSADPKAAKKKPRQRTTVYLQDGLAGDQQEKSTQVTSLPIPDARGEKEVTRDLHDHGKGTRVAVAVLREDPVAAKHAATAARLDQDGAQSASLKGFLDVESSDYTVEVSAVPAQHDDLEKTVTDLRAALQAVKEDEAHAGRDVPDIAAQAAIADKTAALEIAEEKKKTGAFEVAVTVSAPNEEALKNVARRLHQLPMASGYRLDLPKNQQGDVLHFGSPAAAAGHLKSNRGAQIAAKVAHALVPALSNADRADTIPTWKHPFTGRRREVSAAENGTRLGSLVSPSGVVRTNTPVELNEFDGNRSFLLAGRPGVGKTELLARLASQQIQKYGEDLVILAIDAADTKNDLARHLPNLVDRPITWAAYTDLLQKPGALPLKFNSFRVNPDGENLIQKTAQLAKDLSLSSTGNPADRTLFQGTVAAKLPELYEARGYDLLTGKTVDGSVPLPLTMAELEAACLADIDAKIAVGSSDYGNSIRFFTLDQFSRLKQVFSDSPDAAAIEEVFARPKQHSGLVMEVNGLGEAHETVLARLVNTFHDYCSKKDSPHGLLLVDEFNKLIRPGSPLLSVFSDIVNIGRANGVQAMFAASGVENGPEYGFLDETVKLVGATNSSERAIKYLCATAENQNAVAAAIPSMREYHFAVASGEPVEVFLADDPTTNPLPKPGLAPVTRAAITPPELPEHFRALLAGADEPTIQRAKAMAAGNAKESQEHAVIAYLNSLHLAATFAPRPMKDGAGHVQFASSAPSVRLTDHAKRPYQQMRDGELLTPEGTKIALATYFSATDQIAQLPAELRQQITDAPALLQQTAHSTLHSLGLAPEPGLDPRARSAIHRSTGSMMLQKAIKQNLETTAHDSVEHQEETRKHIEAYMQSWSSELPAEFRAEPANTPITMPSVPGISLSGDIITDSTNLRDLWESYGGDQAVMDSLLEASHPMIGDNGKIGSLNHHVRVRMLDQKLHPEQPADADPIISAFREYALDATNPHHGEEGSDQPQPHTPYPVRGVPGARRPGMPAAWQHLSNSPRSRIQDPLSYVIAA